MDEPGLDSIKIPEPIIITAAQINDVSHSRTSIVKRERRLRRASNNKVRQAMGTLSKRDVPLKYATTMKDIDQARETARSAGPTLQDFEQSRANLKEKHNRNLRTKRAWSKVTSSERKKIKDHHYAQGKMNVSRLRVNMHA
jgi:hypothetical protein